MESVFVAIETVILMNKISIEKKEWFFVLLVSVFLMIVTTLPFAYGYFRTSPDKFYLGFHALAPGDYMVYQSYISQVYDGHLLFRDQFTHESQAYNMLNTFWIIPGLIGKVFGLHPAVAFHIGRIIAISILIFSAYLLCSLIFSSTYKRKIGLLFIAFSTGISGYVIPLLEKISFNIGGQYYHKPMDLWVAESNPFLSMMHSGHMALALALLILIFYFTLRFVREQKFILSIVSGALTLFLLSFSPFSAPVIAGVLSAFYILYCVQQRLIHKKLFFHLVIIFLFSLPVLLYYFFILQNDAVMIVRASQNINLTPSWYFLFLSFGFLLPLTLFSVIRSIREETILKPHMFFLLTWIFVQTILIFSPFNFQRRMVLGLFIPIAILATKACIDIIEYAKKKSSKKISEYIFSNKIILFFLFIFFFAFTNVVLLVNNFVLLTQQTQYTHWEKTDKEAFLWLKENADDDSVVFSAPSTGNLLVGLSGRRAYTAHQVETMYFEQKNQLVELFFAKNVVENEKAKIEFLKEVGATHLYFGKQERLLGSYDPSTKEYLELVYENESVMIYEVVE